MISLYSEILCSKGEGFMYTLFIDTHYTLLHVALFKDEKVDLEIKKEGVKHSECFILSIQKLLEQKGITFDDLSGIIVVNGPGSFTGVRIGVVVAKMIGYCKSIPIKVISYLQALSLKYNLECMIGIRDKNGAFIGNFDQNHELVGDYYYLSNQELEKANENIIFDEVINLDKVYEYLKDKKSIPPHFVKPIYVKKIEVDK